MHCTMNALQSFNTASGMRSHVTPFGQPLQSCRRPFQYRKRYEITCDLAVMIQQSIERKFQYRKRYEITCDVCTLPMPPNGV